MEPTTISAAVALLAGVERGVGSLAEMTAALDAERVLRSWVDSRQHVIALNIADLAKEGRAAPVTETLSERGRSRSEARAAAARATACAEHASLGDALATGAISTGHVDAFNKATTGLTDTARANLADHVEGLVDRAAGQTVDAFAKACRDAARAASEDDGLSVLERQRAQRDVQRWVDRDTGMHHTKLSLDPITDEQLWQTISATMRYTAATGTDDGHSWAHRGVDTIVALITRHRSTAPNVARAGAESMEPVTSLFDRDDFDTDVTDPAPTPTAADSGSAEWCQPVQVPEISILIDWHLLTDLAAGQGVCETRDGQPIPIATVRRLCCNADLLPIVLAGDGRPLDVGHTRRLATIDQRRALAAMYTTCGYPDCTVALTHCQAHHVTDWTRHRGATDLDNLLPVCDRHHHLIHEGGWTLTMTPDRHVTVNRPDGHTHHHRIDTTNRRPPSTGATTPAA